MFSMSYTKPDTIQGTLRLTSDPFYYGLGIYKDDKGCSWDIHMIVGNSDKSKAYVCARPAEGDLYSTSSFASCSGFYTWRPYRVEVVKEAKADNL